MNNQLDFRMKIDSLTGHKLPSGIPLRRIVLHVTVKNNKGRIVFESGRVNSNGSVAGLERTSIPLVSNLTTT